MSQGVKFQIFKGNSLLREEVLSQSVINVGKLPSSHLRLDDDSVQRMHALIEVNGPDDVQIVDLGSARGTLVNGHKVTKGKLRSGDDVQFGDLRVVVTFGGDESTVIAPAEQYKAQVAATVQANQNLAVTPAALRPAAVPTMMGMPAPAVARPAPAPAPAPMAAAHVPVPAPAPVPVPAPMAAVPSPFAVAIPVASAATAAPGPAMIPSAIAGEAEEPGTTAIEVQAIYRGIVINTRHLTDPVGESESVAKGLFFGGVGLAVIAVVTFFLTVQDVGAEKLAAEKELAAGKEAKAFVWKTRSPALDVLVFGGFGLGIVGTYMGLKRRLRKKNSGYLIGADKGADAPVASTFAAGGNHALVSPAGGGFVVNATPAMAGEVMINDRVLPLGTFIQQQGATFSLGDRGRAKIDCGDTTFLVNATPKPRELPVPFLLWRWQEMKYSLASAVALLLFLVMIFAVPPDPKSLSLDLFGADNRFINFLIKPPEEKEEEIPEWLKKKSNDEQGGKGKRHKDEEGKMGKKTSKNKAGLYGLKGPTDNTDPHLAKKLAEENAKNAGILGVLKMAEGSHLASIFGRDTALGNDAENVLGGLIGSQIGEAYGVGGLGLVGTGAGGGGTGEGTIGLGNLGTIGKGGGGGNGSGYGRGAGGLGGRRAKAPDVIPGQAAVRGSLDKEIIRRIIRRHINEVKYCYEKELLRKPELGGRVSVQFTIAATGAVVASVLQQSTMGNVMVENCVVQAVRRWEFPKPRGGGIVIVSYPFNFTPAGGGAE